MEIALVGLQFAGKSAVFDLLAAAGGSAPPQGGGVRKLVVKVPDPQLDALAAVVRPKKKTPATAALLDPAPRGGDEGRARDATSDPFAAARTADGLILVLRAFESPQVPHPSGSVDPLRDVRLMRSELVLADLVVIDARLEKTGRMLKVGKKPESPLETPLLERCKGLLEDEKALAETKLTPEERKLLGGFSLMTLKPMLAVLNVGERAARNAGSPPERQALLAEFRAGLPDILAMAVCAPLECELAGMDPDEAQEFLAAEGIEKPGGSEILEAIFKICDRITFYTVIRDEARAWSIPRGSTAAEAAGAVHTDMQRGFIKAETINWRDLVECGSMAAAREKGLLRLEGRDYEVRDGDVMTVKFAL